MAELFEIPELPIRVTARGEWLHGEEPLHPRAEALFEKHVIPIADGTYILRLGMSVAPLMVDDTPYFVRSVALYRTPDGTALRKIDIVVSDDVQEELDPKTLMQSPDHVLYCRVMRHGFWVPCRFEPYHYHALALHAEIDENGGYLPLAGERYYFAPYSRAPRPYGS